MPTAQHAYRKGTVDSVRKFADHLQEKHGVSSSAEPGKPPYGLAWYIYKRGGDVKPPFSHRGKVAAEADGGANCCDWVSGPAADYGAAGNPYDLTWPAIERQVAEGEQEPGSGSVAAEHVRAAPATADDPLSIVEDLAGEFEAAGDGTPTGGGRFLKELCRVGDYVHPQQPTKLLAITPERMDGWVRNFDAGALDMVPMTYSHPKSPVESIQNTHGKLVRLFRKDGSLWGEMELDGDAADKVRKGFIPSVSVGVAPRKDNKGKPLGEVLEHVALTQDPHLTKLAPFEAIAAEGGGSRTVLWFESAGKAGGESTMDYAKMLEAAKKMDFGAMCAARSMMEAAGDATGAGQLDEELKRRFAEKNPNVPYPGHDAALAAMTVAAGSPLPPTKEAVLSAPGTAPAPAPKVVPKEATAEAASAEAAKALEAEKVSLEAKLAETKKANEELRATLANVTAMNEKIELEARKAHESSVRSKVADLQRAKFGLPRWAVEPVTKLLLAAQNVGEKVTLEANGKTEEKSLGDLFLETITGLTKTGMADNRALPAHGKAPLSGPVTGSEEGEEGAELTLEAQREKVNEYLKGKGRKEIDWAKPTPNDARTFMTAIREMGAAGLIELEARPATVRGQR